MSNESDLLKRQQNNLALTSSILGNKYTLGKDQADRSPEIGVFDDMKNIISGPRKSVGGSFLEGMMGGMKYGQRSHERDEKKSHAEKAEAWLQNLEGANAQIFRDIESEKQKQQTMNEQVYPAVEAYLSFMAGNLETGEKPSREEMLSVARDQFNKLKSAGVIQGDFAGIDDLNPSIVLSRGMDGKLEQKNLYGLLPDDMKKANPHLNPMKQVELRQNDQRIDLAQQGMDARDDANQIKGQAVNDRRDKEVAKQLEPFTKKQNILHTHIDDMEYAIDILDSNPDLLGSFAAATFGKPSEDPTYMENQIKSLVSKFSPEDAFSASILNKIFSKNAVNQLASLGMTLNQTLDRKSFAGSPNLQMDPKALLTVLKRDLSEAKHKLKQNKRDIEEFDRSSKKMYKNYYEGGSDHPQMPRHDDHQKDKAPVDNEMMDFLG